MVAPFLLAIALLGSFACASPAPVSREDHEKLGEMMMHFYEQPDPGRVESILRALSEQRILDDPDAIPPVQGFLATVAQQYPEQVAQWGSTISSFPASDQPHLWSALWLAGTPESRAALDRARDAGLEGVMGEEFQDPPPSLRALHVASPTHLDLLWGAFFASGDTAFLEPILGVLDWDLAELEKVFRADQNSGRYLLAVWATAQWSLESNSEQHAIVLAFCQEQMRTAQEPRASLLRKIVEGAQGGSD